MLEVQIASLIDTALNGEGVYFKFGSKYIWASTLYQEKKHNYLTSVSHKTEDPEVVKVASKTKPTLYDCERPITWTEVDKPISVKQSPIKQDSFEELKH